MFNKILSYRINEFISPDIAIAILRIGTSAIMLTHGLPKFLRIIEGDFSFGDPIGLGPELSLIMITFAEFFCAILVLVGFGARAASIPLIIGMAVAYFIAHADDPFSRSEKAFIFMFLYSLIFLTGPGKFSLDRLIVIRKR